MDCIFCDIAAGRRDAEIVFSDPYTLAFLDTRPLFPGHTLIIPRQHHQTLADLPPELLAPLFTSVQRLERAVEFAFEAAGSFVAVNNRVSQSVPHLHVHVVPRRPKDGLKGFFWPRHTYPDGALAEAGARLRDALAQIAAAE
ncbi:MAG TPA: HIT family protein [Bryobacteraceae bacterium]|nr:HIT family protein [Bryobacteraceae bacterium]